MISDTGCGIPESQNALIFEEFKQVDGSISREVGGTGLGLPISKKLIELHNGNIFFESQVGKGSTFRVFLPNTSKNESPSTTRLTPTDFLGSPTQSKVPPLNTNNRAFTTSSSPPIIAKKVPTNSAATPSPTPPSTSPIPTTPPSRSPPLSSPSSTTSTSSIDSTPQVPVVPATSLPLLDSIPITPNAALPSLSFPPPLAFDNPVPPPSLTDDSGNPIFTVLSVDDEASNQIVIKKLLGKKFTIVTANSGQEALNKVNEGLLPDFILLGWFFVIHF